MDIKKILNTQVPYPSGEDFYKLLIKFLGENRIQSLPQVTKSNMQHDPQLYVSLVSVVSTLIGGDFANKLDTNKDTKFLKSEPMIALKNDTYGTYFENKSRAYCYKWLENRL